MPHAAELARSAGDLRLALSHLMRRLRTEDSFPLAYAAVLGRLDRGGPMTTSALAAAEGMRPQSMAQTIAELHEDRLVRRRPDPGDRRQVFIELTELGRRTINAERSRRDDWLAHAIASELSSAEQQVLIRAIPLLRRLSE